MSKERRRKPGGTRVKSSKVESSVGKKLFVAVIFMVIATVLAVALQWLGDALIRPKAVAQAPSTSQPAPVATTQATTAPDAPKTPEEALADLSPQRLAESGARVQQPQKDSKPLEGWRKAASNIVAELVKNLSTLIAVTFAFCLFLLFGRTGLDLIQKIGSSALKGFAEKMEPPADTVETAENGEPDPADEAPDQAIARRERLASHLRDRLRRQADNLASTTSYLQRLIDNNRRWSRSLYVLTAAASFAAIQVVSMASEPLALWWGEVEYAWEISPWLMYLQSYVLAVGSFLVGWLFTRSYLRSGRRVIVDGELLVVYPSRVGAEGVALAGMVSLLMISPAIYAAVSARGWDVPIVKLNVNIPLLAYLAVTRCMIFPLCALLGGAIGNATFRAAPVGDDPLSPAAQAA